MSAGTVKVLSLGAGVQSSTIAMLYEDGTLPDPPDFAVFADTGAEPKAVYEYLQSLQQRITKFPIIIHSLGNIVEDTLYKDRFASAPFFILQDNGKKGMGKRQCTYDYKIKCVMQAIRTRLGYAKFKKMRHKVDMIIGISVDEIQRMKTSQVPWITNKYPLIEIMDWKRTDCLTYFDKKSEARPPRSACWMCPYRNDDEWIHLRENHPEEFKLAVDFDSKIRTLPKFKHQNFLHRSCKPLGEVEFKSKGGGDDQMGIFSEMQNECEGMCGL
jgi:hypothetical protein